MAFVTEFDGSLRAADEDASRKYIKSQRTLSDNKENGFLIVMINLNCAACN